MKYYCEINESGFYFGSFRKFLEIYIKRVYSGCIYTEKVFLAIYRLFGFFSKIILHLNLIGHNIH